MSRRISTGSRCWPALGAMVALAAVLLMPALASASQVYATAFEAHLVSPFAIQPGGALVPIACSTADCETAPYPGSVAVAPNGKFLYTVDASRSVSPFAIQPGGALVPIACSTADCETGEEPFWLAISPNGRFLYVTDAKAGSVSPFASRQTARWSRSRARAAGASPKKTQRA